MATHGTTGGQRAGDFPQGPGSLFSSARESAREPEPPRLTIPPAVPHPVQLADRYRVEREIGRGATAVVYLARDLKLGRPVAIKVIRPELAESLSAERFLREIRVTAQLGHPHILPLFDSGEAGYPDDRPGGRLLYYVMPYVEGESLRELLLREGRLPVAEAVRLAREAADALHHAHARRLVHRDVKPENILVQDGHALVADFGIVRALDQAEARQPRLTDDGFSPGTPAYMSPEQAMGDVAVDARSDQYSLACVLYEMLAGRAPFDGATPRAVMTRRLVSNPEPVVGLRPDTPPHVIDALDRALAVKPADRFATVAEFAAALEGPGAPTTERTEPAERRAGAEGGPQRRPPRTWLTRLAVPAILLLSLSHPDARPRDAEARDPRLDTALYVVVPFRSPGGATGARAALHLYDALSEWDGLKLAHTIAVNDALERASARGRVDGPEGAWRVARTLGAGRVIHGGVDPDGDSLRVEATLYDVASGEGMRNATVRVAQDFAGAADAFAALARSLLASSSELGPPPTSGAGGTLSLPAWRAYERGHLALREWDVVAAAAAFAEAVGLDPDFARAHLWAAQTAVWRTGLSTDRARAADELATVQRAAARAARLPQRDRALAAALLDLAEARYPQACERFDALVSADSLDFAAWYGLGLCQGRDVAVRRDPRSPSQWAFRSSYHGASVALLRAMRVAPSFQRAFQGTAAARLGRVLVTEAGVLRPGYGPGPDGEPFYAYPGLDGDTLAYVPWPARAFGEGRKEVLPATYGRALERNRRDLRTIASEWAHAFPLSADAQEALAQALEATGEIRDGRSADPSALEAYSRALALEAAPHARVRIGQALVRVHLKRGEYERARALADSVLRAWPDSLLRARPERASIADRLAGLAVLTGRAHRAAALRALASSADTAKTPRGEIVLPPPELSADAARLRVYAALGAPVDSIRQIAARADRRLRAAVEPVRREAMRDAVLARLLSLAVSALGFDAVRDLDPEANILVRMQQALARGDEATLRRVLAAMDDARRGLPPGSVAADVTFHETWLLLAAGDTAAAALRLDGALAALSSAGPGLTAYVSEAAALVRAMALRAELAARAGDAATARHWAAPVVSLWADADPELQPLVARTRALAAP